MIAGEGNASRQLWTSAALQCASQYLRRLRRRRAKSSFEQWIFSRCGGSCMGKGIRLLLSKCAICIVRNVIKDQRHPTTIYENLMQKTRSICSERNRRKLSKTWAVPHGMKFFFLLSEFFFYPLLGRTRFRGRCWAAIRLSHRPEPSGRAVCGEVDGLDIDFAVSQ